MCASIFVIAVLIVRGYNSVRQRSIESSFEAAITRHFPSCLAAHYYVDADHPSQAVMLFLLLSTRISCRCE